MTFEEIRDLQISNIIANSSEFKAGDMVMHRKFGKGMILSVTPSGNDVKVEIVFDDVGTKSLMGSFAKLKKA
mgnify:CR=1 FL=1